MSKNEEMSFTSGAESFPTAVFGGFRKEDVLEYMDSVSRELEQLRKGKKELERRLSDKESQLKQEKSRAEEAKQLLDEAARKGKSTRTLLDERSAETERLRQEKEESDEALERERAERERVEEERRRLETECLQLRQEKQDLKQELDQEVAEAERLMEIGEAAEHYKALCCELEDRISTYEKRTVTVSDVLVDAKMQAEQILSDAGAKADYLINQATREAETQKRTAALVRRTVDQNIGQMKLIKKQLQEYLDLLNNVCQGVEEANSGLSQSVIAIPEDMEALQQTAEKEIAEESKSGGTDGSLL